MLKNAQKLLKDNFSLGLVANVYALMVTKELDLELMPNANNVLQIKNLTPIEMHANVKMVNIRNSPMVVALNVMETKNMI